MISVDELKYPMNIEIPEDYWVISTVDGVKVEYIDGDN